MAWISSWILPPIIGLQVFSFLLFPNRRKYHASRTLEDFAAKPRNETDLGALSGDILVVVRQTMQPETPRCGCGDRRTRDDDGAQTSLGGAGGRGVCMQNFSFVIQETLQPAHVTFWLARTEGG